MLSRSTSSRLDTQGLPAFGALRLREVTVPRVDHLAHLRRTVATPMDEAGLNAQVAADNSATPRHL
jgi:hypothetical protein